MNEETGLTLLQALERYSDPEGWAEFQQYAEYYGKYCLLWIGDPGPTEEQLRPLHARGLRQELEKALLSKLQTGELIATGYVEPLAVDAERVAISAEKWIFLELDFDEASASGHGLKLIGIRIREPQVYEQSMGRKTGGATRKREIHDAFTRLVSSGTVEFGRGGLTAATRLLAPLFPNYEIDSIRKTIQPAFNAAKNSQAQKQK